MQCSKPAAGIYHPGMLDVLTRLTDLEGAIPAQEDIRADQ